MFRNALVGLLLVTLSFSMVIAEQNAGDNTENFVPASPIGAYYEGKMQADGDMTVSASINNMPPNAYDYQYYILGDYRQQSLEQDQDGRCLSSVRYYNASDFKAQVATKNVTTMIPTLKGKKFFSKISDPPAVRPYPSIPSLDLTIATIDSGDPYRDLLPQQPIVKNLSWDPNAAVIDDLMKSARMLLDDARASVTPAKPSDDARTPDGIFPERHRPPRRPKADWTYRAIQIVIDKATGKIISFKTDSFTAEITFSGGILFPISTSTTETVPLTGKILLTYSTMLKALVEGNLVASANYDGRVKTDEDTVNLKLNWNEKISISRENRAPLAEAKGIPCPVLIGDAPPSEGPVPILFFNNGIATPVFAWDGRPAFEVLNQGNKLAEVKEMPISMAASSDGQFVIIVMKDKVLMSRDFGESFAIVPLKDSPLKKVRFLTSTKPVAIALHEDGTWSRIDASGGKFAIKKILPPVSGKSLLAVCPTLEPDGIVTYCEDGYFSSFEGSSARKMKSAPAKAPSLMARTAAGVLVLCGTELYLLTADACKQIPALKIPADVADMASDGKTVSFLTTGGDFYFVAIEGGDVAQNGKAITGFLQHFRNMFTGKAEGIEVK
ncbi:MAG: hypothetical protein WC712_02265 [Candidatus Brocadiia bacterium]